MGRWRSPEAAAWRAEKRRKEARSENLMLAGSITMLLGAFIFIVVWGTHHILEHRKEQSITDGTNQPARRSHYH